MRLRRSGAGVCKKLIIAWAVLFVAWFMGNFVVHGALLRSDYMQLPNLFPSEGDQQKYVPLMILAHVILSGAFVWIYARGAEAKPWMAQGVRFGAAVALLTTVPTYMIYFVVQPMPGEVVIKQILYDGVLMVILGTIVAWLYRLSDSSRFRTCSAFSMLGFTPNAGASRHPLEVRMKPWFRR
jgi:hypothetical protein